MSDDDKTPDDLRRRHPFRGELVEWRVADVEKRLAEGAKAFASVRDALDALDHRITEETRVSPWKLLVGAAGVVAIIVGAAIAVGEARSNAEHTTKAVERAEEQLGGLDGRARKLEHAQELIKLEMGNHGRALERIEKKLDEQPALPIRRRPR